MQKQFEITIKVDDLERWLRKHYAVETAQILSENTFWNALKEYFMEKELDWSETWDGNESYVQEGKLDMKERVYVAYLGGDDEEFMRVARALAALPDA